MFGTMKIYGFGRGIEATFKGGLISLQVQVEIVQKDQEERQQFMTSSDTIIYTRLLAGM
jgi:hypothetical protein